ncbi:unnamed protein product [Mesocestoides corti]|uniref:Ubiq_cyt_C_chap domain-containing protein n=1 Tax=Mesocestoides corti TaxID=53468 RepID=A0A0R3UJZ7_MESCO|nr:unnamed protein product [Mesocestoides corti]
MLHTRIIFRSCVCLRLVGCNHIHKAVSTLPPESLPQSSAPGIFASLKYRFAHGLRYPSSRLKLSGENMFAICAEYPEFSDFVTKLQLPDTFQTWFSITTLHIWLCLVRLRREGLEGSILKRAFIQVCCYSTILILMRGFGILRKQHDHIEQFNMQFFGSLFAYDEAFLMHSDCALAGALWRNFFLSSPDTSAFQLETLVAYIRKQLAHLDALPSDQVLGKGIT